VASGCLEVWTGYSPKGLEGEFSEVQMASQAFADTKCSWVLSAREAYTTVRSTRGGCVFNSYPIRLPARLITPRATQEAN